MQLVADLPADLSASVFVVHHFPAQSVSVLPSILNRAGPLPASQPADGEPIVAGRIYVARPDRHMVLRRDRIRLTLGPREQGHRPAIDPLFRSAARHFGPRAIGVVLSGTLDDGTTGLLAIKQAGGLAVVQDPGQAAFPGMPASAIEHVPVDHVVGPAELGPLLSDTGDPPDSALAGTAALRGDDRPGRPSGLVCPECGGVLWESETGGLLHFRCHVGHAYGADSLLAAKSGALEGALWGAVRALEEKAELLRRLAGISRERGLHRAATRFDQAVRDAEHGSNMIRESLIEGPVRQALESSAEPVEAEPVQRAVGANRR